MEEEVKVEETKETEVVRDPEGLLTAYNKAKEDLVALRNEHKELTKRLEELSSDKMRMKALAAESKLALAQLGIKDADRLMPYIGTDGLDFDDSGKVTGLSERLEALKKDLPEVFDPKVRAGGRADIYANDATKPVMTGTEAQVARIFSH